MSETERKTLLLIDNRVKLNGDAYKRLAENGFLILRGDPTQFHIVEPLPFGHGDMLAQAAYKAVRDSLYDDVRHRFCKEVFKELIRPDPPKVST